MDASNLISLRALSFSLEFNSFILTVFRARIEESYLRLTLRTLPKLPLPSYLRISY